MTCTICGNTEFKKTTTYKNAWLTCTECGTAFRFTRGKYPINSLPKFLVNAFPKLKILLPNQKVLKDSSATYDYMASTQHLERHIRQEAFNNFKNNFIEKFHLEIKGKKILDVSGGNGDFIRRFVDLGATVTMTEFSVEAVKYAKQQFNLNAVRFDFNSQKITDVVNDKFDIVFLRQSLNFCFDLRSFLSDLKHLIHDDTIIVVEDAIIPSLGVFLRWQFDDYTYLLLYKPEQVIKLFNEQNFDLVGQSEATPYYYTMEYSPVKKLLLTAASASLLLKAPKSELYQRGAHFIFKPKKS